MDSIDRERLASLEAERARMRQAGAEVERDIATSVAIDESARRSAAENAALNERSRAEMAESGARSASASARAAHEEARDERAVAGNASFVAAIATIVALALICTVGYFAWWQPNHAVDVSTNTVIERTKTVQVPVIQPSNPTVNVAPPHVDVNIQNPPSNAVPQSNDEDLDKNGTGTLDSDKPGGTGSTGPGSGG